MPTRAAQVRMDGRKKESFTRWALSAVATPGTSSSFFIFYFFWFVGGGGHTVHCVRFFAAGPLESSIRFDNSSHILPIDTGIFLRSSRQHPRTQKLSRI